MRYIDLFAGIGGFHYGIDASTGQLSTQSGRTENKETPFEQDSAKPTSSRRSDTSQFRCVYSNEWDKYANSVYRKHFGECDITDITKVKATDIPDHDLLCGGFPCQSFSIAGKRGGFNDTRGTLFFDIARILKEKQPRLCLLENVKGLLSHDNGRTIKTIFATLVELGYDIQWQVCNSKDFGVPQNRERIFIIGHLRGTPRPEVFPIGEDAQISSERQRKISPTITQRYYKQGQSDPYIVTEKPESSKQDIQQEGDKSDSTDTRRGKTYTTSIRRLTPIECERLQGFPDNWTQYGADGELISDTQRYKMCGNAVTTNVVTEIAKRLI